MVFNKTKKLFSNPIKFFSFIKKSFFFYFSRYHNEKMVNYDTQSGFSVTSIQSNVNNNHSVIQTQSMPSTSILSIKEVNLKNAGNYTCAPSNARSAFIMVHVLRGMRLELLLIFFFTFLISFFFF